MSALQSVDLPMRHRHLLVLGSCEQILLRLAPHDSGGLFGLVRTSTHVLLLSTYMIVRRDPYKFAYVIGKSLTSQSETPCFSADRLIFFFPHLVQGIDLGQAIPPEEEQVRGYLQSRGIGTTTQAVL